MITFAMELLQDVWQEMEQLFPLHYAETGKREGGIDLDWETFFALERLGMVHVIVARSGEALVGYFVGMIRPNLHNRKQLIAASDMYFLHPDHRGRAGLQMFREVEAYWRGRGVQSAVITAKVTRPFDKLFRRLGWQMEEQVFLKTLE